MKSNHSTTCFIHMFLKLASVFCYMFLNLFLHSDIYTFIVTMLFVVLDFWINKNITGRILVGLRWWSIIDPDSLDTLYYYESFDYDI